MKATGALSTGSVTSKQSAVPQYGGTADCTSADCAGASQSGYYNTGGDVGPLNAAGNNFQGAVSLAGGTTRIRDTDALTLGTLDTGTLSVTSDGALGLGQGNVAGNLSAASGGGAVSQTGALGVAGTTSIDAGSGAITLNAAGNDFQGAVSLAGGTTRIRDANALMLADADIAAGRSLTVTAGGTITLATDVATTGDQTYAGQVTLATDVVLNAGSGRIDVQGNLSGGGHRLTMASTASAADAIDIEGTVSDAAALSASGNVRLGGDVSTAGRQTYGGAVLLAAPVTLTGTDLNLGRVDGAHALTLAGSGTTTLAGAIGSQTALASISDDGIGTTRLGGSVTTTGTQDWDGDLLLTGDDVYARLLEPSAQVPELNLIEPGAPELSYLYLKLIGDESIVGNPMPYNPLTGEGELGMAEISDIETWIANGAVEAE